MINPIKKISIMISKFEKRAYEYERKATLSMAFCTGIVFFVYALLLLPLDFMENATTRQIVVRLTFMCTIVIISFIYAFYLRLSIKKKWSPDIWLSAALYYTIIIGAILYQGTVIKTVSIVPIFIFLIGLGYSWLHTKQYIIYTTLILLFTLYELMQPAFDYFWFVEIVFFYLFTIIIHIFNVLQKCKIFEYQCKLEFERNHDKLTGLMNRRAVRDSFSKYEQNKPFIATVMIDLDHFKDVNDTFGHDVGDIALKCASDIFQKVFGSDVLVGRLGGDEFIILLAMEEDKRELINVYLNNLLGSVPIMFNYNSSSVTVTFSIGCYLSSRFCVNELNSAISKADSAMYRIKNNGRNGAFVLKDNNQNYTIHGGDSPVSVIKL